MVIVGEGCGREGARQVDWVFHRGASPRPCEAPSACGDALVSTFHHHSCSSFLTLSLPFLFFISLPSSPYSSSLLLPFFPFSSSSLCYIFPLVSSSSTLPSLSFSTSVSSSTPSLANPSPSCHPKLSLSIPTLHSPSLILFSHPITLPSYRNRGQIPIPLPFSRSREGEERGGGKGDVTSQSNTSVSPGR